MKLFLPILFSLFGFSAFSQGSMYRHFPQTQVSYYFNCEMKHPVKTIDGGYIFGFFPWSPNLHSMFPLDQYIIKTDSNFVPQWKKQGYASAISLPTGGIILLYGSTIEKVTPSGVQIWIKHMSNTQVTVLNDGVCYSNKLRIVGRKSGDTGFPSYSPTSQAYSLLIDTSGSFISHSLYTTSYAGDADFSKIKRDPQGNFFVYSNLSDLMQSSSNMSLVKFDTSFTFVWGKTWSSSTQPLLVSDIDFMPNGRIFATGMIRGNYAYAYPAMGALLKFDSQGNLLDQKYFNGRGKISGLCKKPNGNYIVSSGKGWQDSLYMFETDTAMNIVWYNYCGRGTTIGTSIQKNNSLYTPTFYGSNPVMISNSINGNSCASYSMSYSKLTSTVGLSNFTLTATSSSAGINSGTYNMIITQSYVDSCKCPVFIPVNQNNLCVGNTGTISIIGTGNLSWYSTATGNSFIQSGSQFVYSSNTPTAFSIFAQDSACAFNPHRTQINITVFAVPNLSFSPSNPTICVGNQVFVTAIGAINYTWSGFTNNSSVQNLNPLTTTVYTVTGSVAPGCSDTKTTSVNVSPYPSLTISPSASVCLGSSVTLSASGANTYTWIASGLNTNTISVSPSNTSPLVYQVVGRNGFCSSFAQTTITGLPNPTISINGLSTSYCANETSVLNATGANTYTWNTGSTNNAINATPSVTTVYSVTGTGTNNCRSTQTIQLEVYPQPTLTTVHSSSSVCAGDQVTLSVSGASSYTWNNGINLPSQIAQAILGNNIYSVSGSNGLCVKSTSLSFYAFSHPTISISSNPPLYCQGKFNTISATGASSYTWSNISFGSSITVLAVSDTSYFVIGANGSCQNTDTINLSILPSPTVVISTSANDICIGENITLLATGALSYSWNTGSNVNIIYQSPTNNSNYTVTGTNSFGCTNTKTIGINVHPLPLITLSSSQASMCLGESTTLTANGANSYTWNSGFNSPNIIVSPTVTTSYSVIGRSVFGCENINSIIQHVLVCTDMNDTEQANSRILVFPNPTNSHLEIVINSVSEDSFLEIVNALGQVVFNQKINELKSIVNLSSYNSGIYHLNLHRQDKVSVYKIIKN